MVTGYARGHVEPRYFGTRLIIGTKKPPPERGFLLLGYLDSNQEQMKVFFVVSCTRNRGGIPRISAVLME